MTRALLAALVTAVASISSVAAPLFSVPDPMVSGAPGSTVGWGFSVSDATEYLVVTGSSFSPTSLYGNYTDYTSNGGLQVVGPSPENSSFIQSFDLANMLGIGGFTIYATSPGGTEISGTLSLDYSLFSQDPNSPNFDPSTSTLVADASLSQPVMVSITGAPEPTAAGLLLLSAAVCGCFAAMRRSLMG